MAPLRSLRLVETAAALNLPTELCTLNDGNRICFERHLNLSAKAKNEPTKTSGVSEHFVISYPLAFDSQAFLFERQPEMHDIRWP
jgi:hypothetical protein